VIRAPPRNRAVRRVARIAVIRADNHRTKETGVAVRIRLKKLGRRHRPFYRICAMDSRVPRDGKAIEELGYYDPMVKDADARAHLKADRIDYWLSVGAQPSEKVRVLIKKYGTNGTHLDQQRAAVERLRTTQRQAPPPMVFPRPEKAPNEVPPQEASDAARETAESEPVAEQAGSSESGEGGNE
jgi:small subunit ribosomal protein S16